MPGARQRGRGKPNPPTFVPGDMGNKAPESGRAVVARAEAHTGGPRDGGGGAPPPQRAQLGLQLRRLRHGHERLSFALATFLFAPFHVCMLDYIVLLDSPSDIFYTGTLRAQVTPPTPSTQSTTQGNRWSTSKAKGVPRGTIYAACGKVSRDSRLALKHGLPLVLQYDVYINKEARQHCT